MIALLATVALAASVHGSPPLEREWNFRVFLDDREIGEHRFVVRGSGPDREVQSDARFDVRVLFATAYRYRHQAVETWAGDCLAAVASRTETNDDLERVRGTAGEGRLVVDGPAGRREHDGCVMSFAYWNPRILSASRLLNSQTGEVVPVTVTPRGREVVGVRGQSVTADRHRILAPGLQVDLWYVDGRWVALEAPAAGGRRLRYELM